MIISIIAAISVLSIITFVIVQNQRFKRNNKIMLAIYFLLFGLASLGVSLFSPGGFRSIPDNIISLNISAFTQNIGKISETNVPTVYQKFFGKKR